MKRTIRMKDVGAIAALEIEIQPGVTRLLGRNGSGKSTALQALDALVRGTGSVPTRDGAASASVEGLGMRLSVGRRTTRGGELEVLNIEGLDLSLLIDPGIKDPAAADAERIKGLCRLAGAEVERGLFAELVGGNDQLARLVPDEAWRKPDLPSVAAAVKRAFELEARRAADTAENLQADARALITKYEHIPETEALDEAQLQRDLEQAAAERGTMLGRQENAAALQKSAAEAKAALAAMGERGTKAAGEAAVAAHRAAIEQLNGTQAALFAANAEFDRIRALYDEASKAVLEAKRQSDLAAQAERAAAKSVEQAREDNRQRANLRKIAEQTAEAADVDPVKLDELQQLIDTAKSGLQRAERVKEAIAQRERARDLAAEAGKSLEVSNRMRDAAHGCETVLTKLLARVCPDGMSVSEGRLYMATDRGQELFGDLSHGERSRIACAIGQKRVGKGGILILRQEAWEAMDPINRRDFAASALAEGVCVFTAEADAGELRSEPFNGKELE